MYCEDQGYKEPLNAPHKSHEPAFINHTRRYFEAESLSQAVTSHPLQEINRSSARPPLLHCLPSSPSTMPSPKFFSKIHLPGPGLYDLVSTYAEVADYRALEQRVLADEEKRKYEQRKRYVNMGLPETAVKVRAN